MKYKILIVSPPVIGGCQYYRQIHPHEKIAEHYEFSIEFHTGIGNLDAEYLSGFELVQFHKNYVSAKILQTLDGLNIPSMIDFDDFWELPQNHLSFNQYKKEGTTQKLIEVLCLADYVSVTTTKLEIEVKKYNQNTFVFPNAIDPSIDVARNLSVEWDKMNFGYLGGATHLEDVQILQGLNYRMLKTELEYELNLFGYKHNNTYRSYEKLLTTNRKYMQNYRRYAPETVPEYLNYYNLIDVSLVPLANNKFNSLKSELKIIEAGIFGKAVIVSNVHPYKKIIKHKRNGLIANSSADWHTNMIYLIKNPRAATDLGAQLKRDIDKHFNYEEITRKRQKVYARIIKQRRLISSRGRKDGNIKEDKKIGTGTTVRNNDRCIEEKNT